MQDLIVTIIQTDLAWERIDDNLKHFDLKLKDIPEYNDLIILPEMFTTGFSMDAGKLAEQMNGPTITWMKNKGMKERIENGEPFLLLSFSEIQIKIAQGLLKAAFDSIIPIRTEINQLILPWKTC